jgi:hypothetical protein
MGGDSEKMIIRKIQDPKTNIFQPLIMAMVEMSSSYIIGD